jgi:hypothetical protein
VVAALAAARELPQLSLEDALELTALIARKDPRRHPRVAARWLLRYLEECPEATIDEAAMVSACLAALAGNRYQDAALALRAVAERATSRRRTRGSLRVPGLGDNWVRKPSLRHMEPEHLSSPP